MRARELNVAARLIARSDDLEALAAGARTGIQMMEGWRYDVFGHAALDLVDGRMGFAVKNAKLVISELDEATAAEVLSSTSSGFASSASARTRTRRQHESPARRCQPESGATP